MQQGNNTGTVKGGASQWLSDTESPANTRAAGDVSSVLGWEDPLEGEMATHSTICIRIIQWTEKPGGL